MSKKRKRTGRCAAERARRAATRQARAAGRDGVLWRQTAEEATLAGKPRYNGYACGHGAHGDAKYSRAKAKRAWREQIGREGASRGSFPFAGALAVSAFPAPCCLSAVACSGSGLRSAHLCDFPAERPPAGRSGRGPQGRAGMSAAR